MSSHLLPEVSDVCDEVAIIDHGKLLVYDTIANVTRRFSGDGNSSVVEIGLLRDVDDDMNKKLSALSGVVSMERLDSRNLRIRFDSGLEVQERLLSDIASLRIGMISFRASGSALEDTYLNLIKATL